jgi:hypothetical protein
MITIMITGTTTIMMGATTTIGAAMTAGETVTIAEVMGTSAMVATIAMAAIATATIDRELYDNLLTDFWFARYFA